MDVDSPSETKTAIERCAVCKEGQAKYRCPKCLIRTCSLPCVKNHKENNVCNGIRDKTVFTKISNFKDLNLLSDYRFLEDVHRKADSASRDPLKYVGRDLPRHLKCLVNGAKRNGTTLRLLPKSFSKRVKNKTKFLHATKQILWMVEWVFPHAEAKHYDRHLQGDTIADALMTLYDPQKTDSVVRHKLRGYVPKGVEGVRFFMRKESCPANDIRYYELKSSNTIEKSLKGRLVIEFPTIFVVFKDKAEQYPLVDEDILESESESESESDKDRQGAANDDPKETPGSCKRTLENAEDNEFALKKCKQGDDTDRSKTDCVKTIGSGDSDSVNGQSAIAINETAVDGSCDNADVDSDLLPEGCKHDTNRNEKEGLEVSIEKETPVVINENMNL